MKVLIDANVLLDVLIPRPEFAASAAAVWALVESNRVEGFVSAVSFSNIYYIARKYCGRERADAALRAMAGTFQIAPVDRKVIDASIGSSYSDFEDAIQMFAAVASGASHVITRNGGDFVAGPLSVLTPDEFLALMRPSGP